LYRYSVEARERRRSARRSDMQQAWGAYADLDEDEHSRRQG
jgi:hypothetical protein